jgi:hypothetical protein
MKKLLSYMLIAVLFFGTAACEKALEFGRDGGITDEEEILSTAKGIRGLLNDGYAITSSYMGGQFAGLAELMGDNLERPSANNDLDEVYTHNVLFFNGTVGGWYAQPYSVILNINKVLENVDALPEDDNLTADDKSMIRGEALFLRAMAHFELVRLWGHPYGYTGDNSHNGVAYKEFSPAELQAREQVGEIYNKIIADLVTARDLLPDNNGIYADKYAVQALLAKIYFQKGDYVNAAAAAGDVIDNGGFSLGTEVDRYQQNIVLPEVIFQLQSFADLNAGFGFFASNGYTGFYTYRPEDGITNPLYRPTRQLYDLYAADSNDRRIDSNFVIVNAGEDNEFIACTMFNEDYFNVPVLHLTEMKLIRAEALAQEGNDLSTAIQDINDIKERAYGSAVNNLPPTSAASTIIDEVRYERRMELFAEGSRYHEMKRRAAIEGEAIDSRGDPWDCNGMILQFPISEQSDQFEMNPTGGC